MPTMTHPNSRKRIEVPDDRVPMYASQGWRVAESKPARKRATKSTAPNKGAAK